MLNRPSAVLRIHRRNQFTGIQEWLVEVLKNLSAFGGKTRQRNIKSRSSVEPSSVLNTIVIQSVACKLSDKLQLNILGKNSNHIVVLGSDIFLVGHVFPGCVIVKVDGRMRC